MLNFLKEEANKGYTENGAITYKSSLSSCLDLFATIGALRRSDEEMIISRFKKAFYKDKNLAMKILFFGRDIRGGIGERRVFRIIIHWLSENEPSALIKNLALIPEYGRFDDLVELLGTRCESEAVKVIKCQLERDLSGSGEVSLLAKWLPSVNATSKEAVKKAKRLAKLLKMSEREYRKTLVSLRARIQIIENNLRERDYSFDYSKQPSKAIFKYRKAFLRNDCERYTAFLNDVKNGTALLHTGTLMPYEIVAPFYFGLVSDEERAAINTTWYAQADHTKGNNALVVMDGSGSMTWGTAPLPITIAQSLAVYFAERNKGAFYNHFITFSENPALVEIKGDDILEKLRYCNEFNEAANTNIQRVFELILRTAVKNRLSQSELPEYLYFISDMEFDRCTSDASLTSFEYAKGLFASHGYKLPQIVFWNVNSRNSNIPVTMNEQGAALVSGCSPRIFSMIASGELSPYKFMLETLNTSRYASISA